MLREARDDDIPRIARVYKKAFPDSLERIFGRAPSDQPFIDIYRFLLDEFPHYFLVEEEEGKVVGYVVAPPDASRLVKDAILRGYLFRWSWHWLAGKYDFGPRALGILLSDKLALLRSKDAAAEKSEARILSVAVDPDYQGRGSGTKLTAAGMDLLRKAGIDTVMLEVREHNDRAMRLYNKLGFHEVGRFDDNGGGWVQMVAHVRQVEKKAA